MDKGLITQLLKTPSQIRAEEQKALREKGLQRAALVRGSGNAGASLFGGMFRDFAAQQAAQVDTRTDQLKRGLMGAVGMDSRSAAEKQAVQQQEQMRLIQGADNLTRLKAVKKRLEDQNASPVLMAQINQRIEAEEAAVSARAKAKFDQAQTIAAGERAERGLAIQEDTAAAAAAKRAEEDQINAVVGRVQKGNMSYEAYFNAVAEELAKEGLGTAAADYRSKAQQAKVTPKENKPTQIEDVVRDGKTGTVLLYSDGTEKFYETGAEGDDAGPADVQKAVRFSELGRKISEARAAGDTATEQELIVEFTALGSAMGVFNTPQQQRAIASSAEKASQARESIVKVNEALQFLEDNPNVLTGADALIKDTFSNLFGTQDLGTYYRTTVNSVIMSDIINNLPPGVASDKDVALVLKGAPPANASAAVMKQYLRGIAKLNEARIARDDAFNEFMSDKTNLGDIAAFNRQYAEKQLQGRVQALIDAGYTEEQARGAAKTSRTFSNALNKKQQQTKSGAKSLQDRLDAINNPRG